MCPFQGDASFLRLLEVGVDCDGILAHFADHVIRRVNEETGTSHTFADIKTWEIFESIGGGDKKLQSKIYDELKQAGGASNLAVFEGAKEGIARLQEIAHVFIVTSPFRPSATWMSDREEWLHRHFGISARDVVHCSSEKKYRVVADVFVDDKAETVDVWQRCHPGKRGLVWDALYNRDSKLPRVYGWDELYDYVVRVAETAQLR